MIGSAVTTKGTAFAFAYTLLAGPRVMAPRRQLVRLLSAVARSRRATALAGLVIAVLAAGAVFAGWPAPPYFWPLPVAVPVWSAGWPISPEIFHCLRDLRALPTDGRPRR